MSQHDAYTPQRAYGAQVRREGELWTLVLVRELKHPPERVWPALTDPAQLSQWAPFDADQNLGTAGLTVTLTTPGAPSAMASQTVVKRAETGRLLEFDWGGRSVRWELEATTVGTRLTLWAAIDRNFIAMGAAGWHLCMDVLDHLLAGMPLGRLVGHDAMKFAGWHRLHQEYAQDFGVNTP